ncbi:TerC family protein [Evansella sp. AB-P1]|uniref:TerC family protein n=1 Tax=Evansella sp. AB-P1 TaxID=3037653 RepID=UPI00241DC3D8|nr:TerC family protein [Evansella sp. AB-P1]MDG5786336.1 TerC family protein [Evansella sp. AB-P1]
MDSAMLLQYGWVLLVLIGLEGILAADNALVLAIMVKHLPEKQRKKALFYGLAGAFIFRFGSLFIISFLFNVWQVQAVGAIYLLYISLNHLIKKHTFNKSPFQANTSPTEDVSKSGFWLTVLKVELADIAFAVDSILAAIALALTLTPTGAFQIGELDGGQFIVILLGGLIGVIIMRFAATYFVRVLQTRPGLETAAFLIVGWVGIKLIIHTLAHPDVAIIPHHFPESTLWKVVFWSILLLIVVLGWVLTKEDAFDEESEGTENTLETDEDLLQNRT